MKQFYFFSKVFLIAGVIMLASFVSKAQECFYDWEYAMPISIDNTSGGELIEYELELIVDTQTPITAEDMEADGSDIRFTDGTCCTDFFYYIESGINTETTVIWVKVPLINASAIADIYMVYGNPAAVSASNPDSTFSFWEGFDVSTQKSME